MPLDQSLRWAADTAAAASDTAVQNLRRGRVGEQFQNKTQEMNGTCSFFHHSKVGNRTDAEDLRITQNADDYREDAFDLGGNAGKEENSNNGADNPTFNNSSAMPPPSHTSNAGGTAANGGGAPALSPGQNSGRGGEHTGGATYVVGSTLVVAIQGLGLDILADDHIWEELALHMVAKAWQL